MNPCDIPSGRAALRRHREDVEKALLIAGSTHEFDDVLAEMLASPGLQVWDCFGRAVAVTVIHNYPRIREMNIWIAAGEMDAIHQAEPFVAEHARMQGCSRMVTRGRPGWVRANRAAGWTPIAVEIVRPL